MTDVDIEAAEAVEQHGYYRGTRMTIACVVRVREKTGVGLRVAKEAVDAAYDAREKRTKGPKGFAR